jgi:hypothetical protein
MRIPLCILALAVSSWAAPIDTPDQAPTPQTPPPTDAAKPADATPPAPPPKYGGWAFSALADGYFNLNLDHPASNLNELQNFDTHWDQPELSLAKVTIDKSDQMLGIHLDVGVGETMRLIHAGDPAAIDHKGLRYVEQMYAILKPTHLHGTEIDFGQFVTSAGAEVIEANGNWNYSRSLLFALAIPYYHFGVRSTIPVTKVWTVGAQVVNQWNTVWGSHNNFTNVGLTSALTLPKYTWSFNYYVGPNHSDGSPGKRNLGDTTFLLTPNSKINAYINADYGQDNRALGGHDEWYGVAGAVHYQLTKAIAISPRAEFINDKTGFTTGTRQVLKEATITGEYKYNDHLLGRLEYRRDASDHPFFDRGAQLALAKAETTMTLGVIVSVGPYK